MQQKMSMREYHALAQRTSPMDGHNRLDNGCLGLIGETGEIVDALKKHLYQSRQDTPRPTDKFLEELGDVLWYLAEVSAGMGKTLPEVAGQDFAAFDMRSGRNSGRTNNLRRLCVGMANRAVRICAAIDGKKLHDAQSEIRRMLVAAARFAHLNGGSLEEVAAMNIRKLKARYPDGFDAEISMKRYK